ncbi:hypothetical protein AGABI2DRAFT_75362 [Agaricus bisporus var. bisporus H97]|uniref:hypothetical protein n=1 Tax=Agaricus bisporus var. bisporus (strain H97 / ATCC MYA-4626 / FGSC 10389) TaxID=936046 RepID=UPI00029F700D|nr:hypothetical protein AGABI2DRAFT_75362 [Agaricus bisporus var. bisporus H97]EKV43938.1 hypothetical protein AGABI2DRAFT_75362 [Agaricus bisporus var. bisporus H97]
MSSSSESRPATINPLEQFTSYPFDTDQTYQQGLASILAGNALSDNSSSDERDELLRRIRVFYFNKTTGNSITIDEVKAYEQSLNQQDLELESLSPPSTGPVAATTTVPTPSQTTEDTKILSFAEIKELIEAGRLDEIPNNKIIPDSLNDETPSASIVPARKKPWEIASENQGTTPQDVEV